MADRGVIFAAPMVRALWEGRKLQTRRLLKPAPDPRTTECPVSVITKPAKWAGIGPSYAGGTSQWDPWRTLAMQPGARLYVRESMRLYSHGHDAEITYLANDKHRQTGPNTGEIPDDKLARYFHYCDRSASAGRGIVLPAMHMPRWASRMCMTVSAVRVQRLQDISEADAIAEGVVWQEPTAEDREWAMQRAEIEGTDGQIDGVWTVPGAAQSAGADVWACNARDCYRFLWNSLHTKPGERWDDNPWVVATSWPTVERRNIDA